MDGGIGDLRLRVEASFSASELRDLARKWGLPPEPGWEKSPSDFARGLLKDAERTFGLHELVRRLRVEKPVVEWPEVVSTDAEKWGPPSVTAVGLGPGATLSDGALPAVAVDPTLVGETTVVGAPEGMERVAAASVRPEPAGVLGHLELPVEGPPPSSVGVAVLSSVEEVAPASLPAPHSTAPSSRVPSSVSPASAPASVAPSSRFPGTVVPEPPKPRSSVDTRILFIVAGAMVGLAALAFGAGLLWSRSPRDPSPSAPKAASNPNGLAGRAASVLDAALLGVADKCEIDVGGAPSVDILVSAQEGCGHGVRESRRRALSQGSPEPGLGRPRPQPEDSDDRRPIRTPSQSGPGKPRCITSCASGKSSCMSECGPEPGDASKFDVWQACSGRCLASESRCRLGCR